MPSPTSASSPLCACVRRASHANPAAAAAQPIASVPEGAPRPKATSARTTPIAIRTWRRGAAIRSRGNLQAPTRTCAHARAASHSSAAAWPEASRSPTWPSTATRQALSAASAAEPRGSCRSPASVCAPSAPIRPSAAKVTSTASSSAGACPWRIQAAHWGAHTSRLASPSQVQRWRTTTAIAQAHASASTAIVVPPVGAPASTGESNPPTSPKAPTAWPAQRIARIVARHPASSESPTAAIAGIRS